MVKRFLFYRINRERYHLSIGVRNECPAPVDPDPANTRLPIVNPAKIRAEITADGVLVEFLIECSFQRSSPLSLIQNGNLTPALSPRVERGNWGSGVRFFYFSNPTISSIIPMTF